MPPVAGNQKTHGSSMSSSYKAIAATEGLELLRVSTTWQKGTVCDFRQKFALDDAVGSHACSLEANMRVTHDIPLGCPLLLPVSTVNFVQTLKVERKPLLSKTSGLIWAVPPP
jgi:hypothetical protein